MTLRREIQSWAEWENAVRSGAQPLDGLLPPDAQAKLHSTEHSSIVIASSFSMFM